MANPTRAIRMLVAVFWAHQDDNHNTGGKLERRIWLWMHCGSWLRIARTSGIAKIHRGRYSKVIQPQVTTPARTLNMTCLKAIWACGNSRRIQRRGIVCLHKVALLSTKMCFGLLFRHVFECASHRVQRMATFGDAISGSADRESDQGASNTFDPRHISISIVLTKGFAISWKSQDKTK